MQQLFRYDDLLAKELPEHGISLSQLATIRMNLDLKQGYEVPL